MSQHSVRAPKTLWDAIDALAQKEAERTGYNVCRSDIVRRVLIRELQRVSDEKEARQHGPNQEDQA